MIVATSINITRRQQLFVREYLVDLNGAEAAIRAGYKPDNAKVVASTMLAKPEIRAAVSRLQRKSFERVDINAAEVLRELGAIAFSNMADFISVGEDGLPVLNLSKLDRDQWAAVSEYTEDATGGQNDGERRLVVRRKVKLTAKVEALALLAKHFGLVKEKVEHDLSDRLVEKLAAGRGRASNRPKVLEMTA